MIYAFPCCVREIEKKVRDKIWFHDFFREIIEKNINKQERVLSAISDSIRSFIPKHCFVFQRKIRQIKGPRKLLIALHVT